MVVHSTVQFSSARLGIGYESASAGCATTFTTNTHVGEISPRLSARHQKKYEQKKTERERSSKNRSIICTLAIAIEPTSWTWDTGIPPVPIYPGPPPPIPVSDK